jgi:signal transduction histidine kinase
VAAVVEQVLCDSEPQLRAAGFQCQSAIGRDLPAARIDSLALAQAVGNLLDNAMKYSGSGKTVELAVFCRNAEIAIQVADRGIGIPRSEHARIFDRFHRVSSPLVHNTKGSGLGLAIARHIVEAHGGRITVESAPGEGSTFTIWIPALAEASGAECRSPKEQTVA